LPGPGFDLGRRARRVAERGEVGRKTLNAG